MAAFLASCWPTFAIACVECVTFCTGVAWGSGAKRPEVGHATVACEADTAPSSESKSMRSQTGGPVLWSRRGLRGSGDAANGGCWGRASLPGFLLIHGSTPVVISVERLRPLELHLRWSAGCHLGRSIAIRPGGSSIADAAHHL
eukprot:scaffold85714_cov32-Tisochrysis_lutea.AAC.2